MTTTLSHITSHFTDTHAELSPDAQARAIWSIVSEPGDPDAGELIAALGAFEALQFVLEDSAEVFEKIDIKLMRERLLPRATPGAIRQALTAAVWSGAALVTPEHPHWPAGFADLNSQAPHALWARGDTSLLGDGLGIAVVGARAATGYGEHITMEITAGLVNHGLTIISGASYGIDGMAHRAALASHGNTIAILAGGVDRFYPNGHDALLTRIAAVGVVASEASCGQPPTKLRFIQRNRLIAAASTATVVMEAGYRSGSLNTAGHALALGRPVGAVPGPVTSAASAGCHRLIRELGATLVTTVQEVLEL